MLVTLVLVCVKLLLHLVHLPLPVLHLPVLHLQVVHHLLVLQVNRQTVE